MEIANFEYAFNRIVVNQLWDLDPQYVIDMETVKEILLLEQQGNLARDTLSCCAQKDTGAQRLIRFTGTCLTLMYESPFLRAIKNKLVPLDLSYLHEVEVLRAMLGQESRQGDPGWGGSWTKERYQTLKNTQKHSWCFRWS